MVLVAELTIVALTAAAAFVAMLTIAVSIAAAVIVVMLTVEALTAAVVIVFVLTVVVLIVVALTAVVSSVVVLIGLPAKQSSHSYGAGSEYGRTVCLQKSGADLQVYCMYRRTVHLDFCPR